MKKIVVVNPVFQNSHLERISRAAAESGYQAVFFQTADEARSDMPDAEILFGYAPDLVKDAPCLRWVCTPNAGTEPYAQPGFLPAGVILSNSAGAYGLTIAEHIVMVTLEMMRRREAYREIVRNRQWERGLPIRAIHSSRILLLGAGSLATEAARRLRAFQPASVRALCRSGRAREPEVFDSVGTMEELDALLPLTDLLVMCLPGTAETAGLMSAGRLALLPHTAYLVNVGRGSAVDQAALCRALQKGELAGAALDVFEKEPVPADDPVWNCPNLIMTPHISGNMTLPQTVDLIADLFIEDFGRWCAGEPLRRQVNMTLGY